VPLGSGVPATIWIVATTKRGVANETATHDEAQAAQPRVQNWRGDAIRCLDSSYEVGEARDVACPGSKGCDG